MSDCRPGETAIFRLGFAATTGAGWAGSAAATAVGADGAGADGVGSALAIGAGAGGGGLVLADGSGVQTFLSSCLGFVATVGLLPSYHSISKPPIFREPSKIRWHSSGPPQSLSATRLAPS